MQIVIGAKKVGKVPMPDKMIKAVEFLGASTRVIAAVSRTSPWTMVRRDERIDSERPVSESKLVSLVGVRATDILSANTAKTHRGPQIQKVVCTKKLFGGLEHMTDRPRLACADSRFAEGEHLRNHRVVRTPSLNKFRHGNRTFKKHRLTCRARIFSL